MVPAPPAGGPTARRGLRDITNAAGFSGLGNGKGNAAKQAELEEAASVRIQALLRGKAQRRQLGLVLHLGGAPRRCELHLARRPSALVNDAAAFGFASPGEESAKDAAKPNRSIISCR